jgi:parallel beta-helix repeat protein
VQRKPWRRARPASPRVCSQPWRVPRLGRVWLLAAAAIALAGALLAGGHSTVAQTPVPTPLPVLNITPGPDLTNVGVTYYVDNDIGDDAFTCQSATVGIAPPTGQVPGPCKTIQHAIDLTRDRDLVIVASQEPIQVQAAIEVPDLIGVFATGFLPVYQFRPGDCENVTGGSKVVLQSAYGGPVFHVTAAGGKSLHALIAGFVLGGTTDPANPGAIVLDHDEYSEIRCNVIGQDDLPNGIGVLTRGSERPYIHDNTVHGSAAFPIAVSLTPSPPVGGFGLVTDECLGDSSRSDQLEIAGNLFSSNSNAGIWICSDGSGGHLIDGNNIRDNGRGIVLFSVADTTIRQNTIGDNYYDGVDLLDASQDNQLDGNSIESQDGPSSAGVVLQGSGDLFPLGNTFNDNQIRRNRVDVLISGARATRFVGNSINAIGERTGVLFAIGNAGDAGGPRFGQPSGTIFRTNKLYANGDCTALRGCAIRLLPGVISSIDATQNDFGVSDSVDIQAAIWDHARDPELSTVIFSAPQGVPVSLSPTPAATLPPFLVGAPRQAPVAPAPVAAAATPAQGAVSAPPQVLPAARPPVAPVAAGTPAPAPSPAPPSGAGASTPIAYLDPGTGEYYVDLTLCVTNAAGQPVPSDALTVAFFDGAGAAQGSTQATTDTSGCFSGDVQANGPGANVLPATVAISDASGGTSSLSVLLGTPLVRPPRNPLP